MEQQLGGTGLTLWEVAALVVGICGAAVMLINLPAWPASRYRVLGGLCALVAAVLVWSLTNG